MSPRTVSVFFYKISENLFEKIVDVLQTNNGTNYNKKKNMNNIQIRSYVVEEWGFLEEESLSSLNLGLNYFLPE